MFNVFPQLLTFGLIAPFLLRIFLVTWLVYVSFLLIKGRAVGFLAYFESREYPLARVVPLLLAIIAGVTGLFLLFGVYTQLAAIITIFILATMLFIEHRSEQIMSFSTWFYVLAIIVCISLLFSGAGFFAVDYQL